MPRSRRFAILSDIHANIEALEAVLRDVEDQRVDEILCLGDVVGYNAAPSECIKRIRALGCKTVKGNHDLYCSDKSFDLSDFQDTAASVIEWTRRQLSDDDIEWLHNLPFTKPYMGLTMVHSSLDNPDSFRYIFDETEAKDNFATQHSRFCFHGHTHVPCVFVLNAHGQIIRKQAEDCALDNDVYFINVGSVGQPRDGIPKACYTVFDMADMKHATVEFRRVDYDVDAAVARITEANLPARLCTRLYTGR